MPQFAKRPALSIDGRPRFLLGVNYWSRAGGPRMWDRKCFDEQVVREELSRMRQAGLNTCRSFAFIPSMMPGPGQTSPTAFGRLRRFFELCAEAQVWTIPSFLVGHMSGENYDFPGQGDRSLYADAGLLAEQRLLVEAVAGAAGGQPAVIAFLASNEMPRWGGSAPPAVIRRWAEHLRQALRARDSRPFGIGDGVMNLDGGEDGFNVEMLRDLVDFVGPHTYYADADPLRQAFNAEYCLRSLTYLGLPLIFEEFGGSSTQVAEDHHALYYREVLHSCLGVGASGALGWCWSDFDLVDEAPYCHHAFELGFGITRADGSEKPVCDELRRFSRLVDTLDFATLRTPVVRAAIVVPSYFNKTYPFCWEDRQRMRRTLLQAYVLCASVNLEVELVPETADLSRYALLLAPSTQKLLAPTWRRMQQLAAAGHTIYWSYFGGDHDFHQGAWCHNFAELTGCRHRLRYGCADLPPESLAIAGDALRIALSTNVGAPFPRAYLPVELQGAELVATDADNRPAVLRARHGTGQVLLCTYPLEYYLAEQVDAVESSGVLTLYRMLARASGLAPPTDCEHPAVQARHLQSRQGAVLSLFNHGWNPATASVDTPGGAPLAGTDAPLPPGRQSVELPAKHALLYRLTDD